MPGRPPARATARAALAVAVTVAVAAAALCAVAGVAHAAPRRFAVIVGQATGLPGDEPLRFAETDAQRVAAVLRELGGFAAEDVVVLSRSKAAEVRRALITVNARLREKVSVEPGDSATGFHMLTGGKGTACLTINEYLDAGHIMSIT